MFVCAISMVLNEFAVLLYSCIFCMIADNCREMLRRSLGRSEESPAAGSWWAARVRSPVQPAAARSGYYPAAMDGWGGCASTSWPLCEDCHVVTISEQVCPASIFIMHIKMGCWTEMFNKSEVLYSFTFPNIDPLPEECCLIPLGPECWEKQIAVLSNMSSPSKTPELFPNNYVLQSMFKC